MNRDTSIVLVAWFEIWIDITVNQSYPIRKLAINMRKFTAECVHSKRDITGRVG